MRCSWPRSRSVDASPQHTFFLGRRERAQVDESLRGGKLVYHSANGLKAPSRLLIEVLPKRLTGRMLTALDSEAAVALAAAALYPGAHLTHFELDAHVAKQAASSVKGNHAERIEVVAQADLPGIAWPEPLGTDA